MSHPIQQILLEAGYPLNIAGDYWRTTAKYRGGDNATAIAVHRQTGRWKDFVLDSPWQAPEELARLILGQNTDFSSYAPVETKERIKVVKIYPQEILKRLLPQFDFFINRGISKETLKLFQAGMAHSGKLNRRICFPVYDQHNRIVGFAGRWFQTTPFGAAPKWKLLGDKRLWTYPCHLNDGLLRESKEVIIIESIGDLLALWDAGIKHVFCIFGTSLSLKQLSYIIGLDPKRIIIATNNDSGNNPGKLAANKIILKISKHFDNIDILDRRPEKKDFGAMTKKEILDWHVKISLLNPQTS